MRAAPGFNPYAANACATNAARTFATRRIQPGPRQTWLKTGSVLLLVFFILLGSGAVASPYAMAPAQAKSAPVKKAPVAPAKKKAPDTAAKKIALTAPVKKKRQMTSQELNFRIVLASYTWPDGANGDQCKIWAQWVVARAGGFLPAGYRNEQETRGFGIKKPVAEAIPGDIFQMDKPHTAIVIKNLGEGRLLVRDSNWVSPLKVGEHVLDTNNYLQYNPRVYTVVPD